MSDQRVRENQSVAGARLGRQNARPTIGFVTSAEGFETGAGHWLGMMDEARAQDVNVVCFPGAILRSPDQAQQYARPMCGIVYDLVNPDQLQGLIIWTSMLSWYSSPQQMAEFFEQYRPLPMVSVEVPIEGYPCVLIDDYGGMKQAVNHLIEVHGLQRLAFIKGPEAHVGAQERYRAYVDALAEHHIPLDPNLVTPPNLLWSGEEINTLLDERGLRPGVDIQAIVGANTHSGVHAMEIAKSRGVRFPDDLALVTFDMNSEEVYINNPPLTAVNQQIYEVSRQCMRLMLAQLRGETVPAKTVVPARLIIGQSCGCAPRKVIQAAGGGLKMVRPTHVGSLAEHKPSILNGLPPSQTVSAASVAGLLEALMVDIGATPPADEGDQRPPGLLRMLETQLSRIVDAAQTAQAGESAPNEQLDSWQETISALRFASLPYLKGAQLAQANDLWQQAQALVGEITLRIQGVEQVRIDSQARRLRSLSQTLITTFDAAQVMDILAEALPGLGIPSAYLSLYEDSDNPTNQARLILAYTENGRIPLETAGRTFPTCTLLPADVLPQDRPYSLVVHPLYFGQTHLGVALFELGVRQGVLYEALRGEISSALQGALLVRRVQERSAELARQQYILNTFMENVPDPIYFKDLDSRITRANKAHAIMLGLSDLAEEIGKSDLDFFPEELARAKHEQEREIIRTGQPVLNVEESNGMGRWALTTKMPLRDENGNIIGTFGISRDISERKRTEETLAHERNLLRTLIDSIPDQIYAKDTQGRFTLANAAQAHLRGMTTPDELVGKSDFDFYPDALAEQYRASEQPILSAGQSLLEQEEPNLDAANNQIWTATTKVPLRNQQGQIIGLVGVSRDVTERRKLMADLERRALELQTAAEISRATSSILSLDELLPQAVELIRTRFDLYYIGLFLMDETGQWAVLRAGTGEPGRKMLEAGHKLKSSGASMIGWCIANSQARIALDVGEEVVRFSNPLLPLTRSEAALPIISRGRVIGAMTIQSDQPAALTQEDITVLQTIADQLANAIENARLFEQTQSALATVEATHRRYLGEQWKTYLAGAVERPIGYVVNPTGLAPASDVWTPEMEQALSLGAPVTLSTPPEGNAAPARSALAVPIQLHGLPIGVLDFYDEGAERAWSKDERALVEALADQIALALENARLLEQTQQRARREQLIAEIAAKMRAAPDVEGVLRATVHEIRRALGVSHGVIRLGEAAHTAAGNGQTGEGDDRNE